MKEGDESPINVTDAGLERLRKLFARKPPKPFDIETLNLLILPGSAPVIDVEHPERIDWRHVGLAIDMDEGRYQHILLDRKDGGRRDHELARCPVFDQVIGRLVTRLYDRVWPDRENGVLTFPGGLHAQWIFTQPETGAAVLSLHGNAKSQKHLKGMSNHERLALRTAWKDLAAEQCAKKDRTPW